MTTHLTKIWWDVNNHTLVKRVIPEAEIDEREWVGLTESELFKLWVSVPAETEDRFAFARAVEAKLKEKNT